MKALFRCEKNWQKINVQRFSANFLFSKNGKCRSITYSGDFATLPFHLVMIYFMHKNLNTATIGRNPDTHPSTCSSLSVLPSSSANIFA